MFSGDLERAVLVVAGRAGREARQKGSRALRSNFDACCYAEIRSRLLPQCFPGTRPKRGEADLEEISN